VPAGLVPMVVEAGSFGASAKPAERIIAIIVAKKTSLLLRMSHLMLSGDIDMELRIQREQFLLRLVHLCRPRAVVFVEARSRGMVGQSDFRIHRPSLGPFRKTGMELR